MQAGSGQKRSGIGTGRLLVILLVAACFAALAYMLLHRQALRQSAGVHTDKSGSSSSAAASPAYALSGYYTLRAYGGEGQEQSGEGSDSWYLIFNPDGTGIACLMGNAPVAFRYTADQLQMEDGAYLRYSVSEERVTVYSSAVLLFTKSDAPAPENAKDRPFDLANSTWYGSLEIRNHSGKGSLRNGEREIWAVISIAEDGRRFFDIYDTAYYNANVTPVLSMWVEISGDTVIPIIGEEDAWIFERYLTSGDTDALTLHCENQRIFGAYHYSFEKERCDIQFVLNYDP